jgi:hypothetical protein
MKNYVALIGALLLVTGITVPSIAVSEYSVSQKTLSAFSGSTTTLNAQQMAQVKAAVDANPSAEKFICTGIRFESAPMTENIVVRKRAKAACDYAKQLNPALSTWFQNKPTAAQSYAGKVLLTIKSPVGDANEVGTSGAVSEPAEPPAEKASWDSQDPWIRGLSVYRWETKAEIPYKFWSTNASGAKVKLPGYFSSMIEILGTPDGCSFLERPRGTDCVFYAADSSGKFVFDSIKSPAQLWLSESIDFYLDNGGLTILIGTEPSRGSCCGFGEFRPSMEPPSNGFIELARTTLTRELIELKQCNPFADQISRTVSVQSREQKMGDLRWEGMFGNTKSLLEDFAVGTQLDGVTQVRTEAPVTYGFPTGNKWVNYSKPSSGLYHSNSNDWTSFVLDCSRPITRLIPEYKQFRVGQDGVIMYFHVLKGHPTTNVWVTINGRKYQIEKNGKVNIPANSPIKNCKTIDSKFYGSGYFACFVPQKFGDYKISVTEQYVGSGNLIITCRGNWVKVNCSSARDKSVTASISGTFTIGPNGTQGPAWWPYNNER